MRPRRLPFPGIYGDWNCWTFASRRERRGGGGGGTVVIITGIQVSVQGAWDRPSPFVACHPSQKDGWLTDDKKTIVCPTWSLFKCTVLPSDGVLAPGGGETEGHQAERGRSE